MQYEATMNVQESIRPGMEIDTMYATSNNSLKQMHPTLTDNRFFINLPSLNTGSSSTVTFNPAQGLQEVILTLQLPVPKQTVAGQNAGYGLALPEGWGYYFLKRLGYRYGSSQLYYITGSQNLMQCLSLCEDSGKKQQMLFLGGQAILSTDDWADANKRTAYIMLRLPHSSPALSGGALPFNSDILTAPIQLQIDLANFSEIVSAISINSLGPDPVFDSLSSAVVNFTQVTFQDSEDLVARKFDMSRHALTIPLCEGWCQEATAYPFSVDSKGAFQLSLTGCKAGMLQKVRLFFVNPANTPQGGRGIIMPNYWIPPTQLTMAVNGLIYFDSTNGSYLLNNLIRRRHPPVVTYSKLQAPVSGATFGTTAYPSTWVEIDLAQPNTRGNSQEVSLFNGLPLMNSVLNLSGVMPVPAGATSQNYICFVEYVLCASWMASRGSAEFIF